MIQGDSGVKVSIVGGYSMGHVWGKQVHMSTCKGICDIYNQPMPSNVPSEGLQLHLCIRVSSLMLHVRTNTLQLK